MKKFSLLRFLLLTLLISALTFISYIALFGREEGTISNNWFANFFADSYYFFRFPTHFFWEDFFSDHLFFIGLLINAILYAFLIEAIIIIVNSRNLTKNNLP